MLNSKEFDLWAEGYDKTVEQSEASGSYPFVGYQEVLGSIYRRVRAGTGRKVLDVGFGTAVLTRRLYQDGYCIFGMDFSETMLRIAREKMPEANLIQHDFASGFPDAFAEEKFDFILCTYAIHHLTTEQKLSFVTQLLQHLHPGGQILVGDVAFETEEELENCRKEVGESWDEEEIYPVYETLKPGIPGLQFQKVTFCSGVLFCVKE